MPDVPVTPRPPRRPFEVGAAVGKTFSVWFSNFIPFTVLSVLIHIPVIAGLAYRLNTEMDPVAAAGLERGMNLLSNLLGFILQAAVVFGVFQQLRNQRASFGACLAKGLSRMVPALVTGIGVGLACMVPMLAFGCLGGVLAIGAGPVGFVVIGIGLIPTAIVYMMLFVSVPAVVVEARGMGSAMQRSQDLTRGSRVRVFLAFVLFLILSFGLIFAMGLALAAFASEAAVDVGATALGILFAPALAVLPAVVYHDLRVAKDGVSIEDLAKAFD